MTVTLQFTKGHSAGNDFVLFTDPDGVIDLTVDQVRAMCDRHRGIGADGVIRAVRSASIPDGADSLAEDADAEWFMDYSNSDGSAAQMCGNGIRVYAQYLIENGLVQLEHGETLAIGTMSGVRDIQRNLSGFQVDLGRWSLRDGEPLVQAKALGVARPGLEISIGNPHVVVALSHDDELDEADLSFSPVIDPPVADGANVEFVVPVEPLVSNGIGRIRMRVHERGSGETLSCGTGTAAAALAIRHWAGGAAPNQWQVEAPGGTLAVRMFPTEEGEHVALSGPVELVYAGELTLD